MEGTVGKGALGKGECGMLEPKAKANSLQKPSLCFRLNHRLILGHPTGPLTPGSHVPYWYVQWGHRSTASRGRDVLCSLPSTQWTPTGRLRAEGGCSAVAGHGRVSRLPAAGLWEALDLPAVCLLICMTE